MLHSCATVAQLHSCATVAQLPSCATVAQLHSCATVAQLLHNCATIQIAFIGYEAYIQCSEWITWSCLVSSEVDWKSIPSKFVISRLLFAIYAAMLSSKFQPHLFTIDNFFSGIYANEADIIMQMSRSLFMFMTRAAREHWPPHLRLDEKSFDWTENNRRPGPRQLLEADMNLWARSKFKWCRFDMLS